MKALSTVPLNDASSSSSNLRFLRSTFAARESIFISNLRSLFRRENILWKAERRLGVLSSPFFSSSFSAFSLPFSKTRSVSLDRDSLGPDSLTTFNSVGSFRSTSIPSSGRRPLAWTFKPVLPTVTSPVICLATFKLFTFNPSMAISPTMFWKFEVSL